eukprot:6179978-Pleurochrysis_carterae.AAC.1
MKDTYYKAESSSEGEVLISFQLGDRLDFDDACPKESRGAGVYMHQTWNETRESQSRTNSEAILWHYGCGNEIHA